MQLVLLLQHVREGRLSRGCFICGLHRPLLAPWYRLVADGERLLLEHGRSVVCFRGAAVRVLLPALLPLLDGTRTVAEVLEAAGSAAAPAIEQALELLEQNGLLFEGPPASLPAANALAGMLGVAPMAAEERLLPATVGVVGGAETADAVVSLLRASAVGRVERLSWDARHEADLVVVMPAADETGRLEAWNAGALADGRPWLAVRPFDGQVSAVGPLVVPGESACFECLVLRMAGHLEYGRDLHRIEAVPVAASATAPLDALVSGIAAHLALVWIGGPDATVPGKLYILETRPALTLAPHDVLRVPRCPACSHVARVSPPLPWHPAPLPSAPLRGGAGA